MFETVKNKEIKVNIIYLIRRYNQWKNWPK